MRGQTHAPGAGTEYFAPYPSTPINPEDAGLEHIRKKNSWKQKVQMAAVEIPLHLHFFYVLMAFNRNFAGFPDNLPIDPSETFLTICRLTHQRLSGQSAD